MQSNTRIYLIYFNIFFMFLLFFSQFILNFLKQVEPQQEPFGPAGSEPV